MDLKNHARDKDKNIKLQESVDFTSARHDEIIEKIQITEENRTEDGKYINHLEDKIEHLEGISRSTSLEIRNIPKNHTEFKQDLVKIVIDIGKCIDITIHKSDAKDVFRLNKKSNSKPIIIDFTTVPLKENVLIALKKFNRVNKDNKLNTGHVNMDCPKVSIYISENLTPLAKGLYFLTRDFASQNQYKHCWTSHGSGWFSTASHCLRI